jgi:hypothetical protein
LETNKEQPGKRTNQLSIIEELGKDPQKVISNAQAIANAFDRFLASSASSSTNIRTLTNEQVALLTSMAETMLKNQQGTSGLIIMNQLLRKPDFVLKPETLAFIKKASFAKNNKQAQEKLAQFIETILKNKNLSVVDLAIMIDHAKNAGIGQEQISEWNKKVDALIKTIKPQDIQRMGKDELVEFGKMIQNIMDHSPETGLDLLAKFMQHSIITQESLPELVALYQVLLMGMKPVAQQQMNTALSLLPNMLRLEVSFGLLEPKQQEALNKTLKSLTDTYIKVIKQSKATAKNITDYVTTYVDDKAKDLETLLTAAQLTEIAKQEFGITDKNEAYNTWLAKIADKAYVINNNIIGRRIENAQTPADLMKNLKDVAQLLSLMRLSTNLYSATTLANLIKTVEEQRVQLIEKMKSKDKSGRFTRQVKTINEGYVSLKSDLNERLNWLVSSF